MRLGSFILSSLAFTNQESTTISPTTPKMAVTKSTEKESIAAEVDPAIYGKSGDLQKHMDGVKAQYDTKDKLEFYAQVMGDGTANIHFGKWDNIDLDEEGAYGKASEQITDYMFELAAKLKGGEGKISYVDLGSGAGAAALRLCEKNDSIEKATCLNLCDEQNALATKCAADAGLGERITVVTGTYEEAPFEPDSFDIAFSQDAFVHAFSKAKTFEEALRITKSGGVFVFCDLMCGSGEGVSDEELATFAATNMVNDWLSPEENVKACEKAGWTDVTFVDLTADIRISFQLMLKKVEKIIAAGNPDKIDETLLNSYKKNLANRVVQVDRGVFKWGVVHAKKL
mmetsp:Transcript_29224/g.47974  ORF Transcript_29224/g.47974 Transcript_29224/m.47974 type:complete len:342 (-) Transcript_29224:1382-2407(-)